MDAPRHGLQQPCPDFPAALPSTQTTTACVTAKNRRRLLFSVVTEGNFSSLLPGAPQGGGFGLFCSYKLSGAVIKNWQNINICCAQCFLPFLLSNLYLGLFEGIATASGTPPLLLPFIRSLEVPHRGFSFLPDHMTLCSLPYLVPGELKL